MPAPRSKPPTQTLDQSEIQTAIEQFFDHLDDDTGGAASPDPRQRDRGRIRTRGDGRADALVDGLIRVLIRKDGVKQADVDAAFERAIAKLPLLVNAEVVLVYLLLQRNKIVPLGKGASKLVLAHAFRATIDPAPRFDHGIARSKQQALDPNAGHLGRVLADRAPKTLHDVKSDPSFTDDVGKAAGFETRSLLSVPLADQQEVYGVVQLLNKDRASGAEFFSMQDQQLVEEVARHVARIVRRNLEPKLATGEGDMARYVAHLARTDALDLLRPDPRDPAKRAVELDHALWAAVGLDPIRKYQILPIRKQGENVLHVVMANPLDAARRRYFELATEHTIGEAFAATPAQSSTSSRKSRPGPRPRPPRTSSSTRSPTP